MKSANNFLKNISFSYVFMSSGANSKVLICEFVTCKKSGSLLNGMAFIGYIINLSNSLYIFLYFII